MKKTFFIDPTPGRIIVLEDDFSYRGKIVIPDAAKRRPTVGKILAVGEGVNEMFKVDQKVVYGLYSGTVLEFKEQPCFRVLGQEEILGIVRDASMELKGVGVGT